MPSTVSIDDDLALATVEPDGKTMFDWSRAGFNAVVDLQTKAEEPKMPAPLEASAAATKTMAYRHLPVAGDLDRATVDRFRAELARLPKPIVVHCGSGRRAGAMLLMHVAPLRGLSGEQALAWARELGLDLGPLEADVRAHVDAARVA